MRTMFHSDASSKIISVMVGQSWLPLVIVTLLTTTAAISLSNSNLSSRLASSFTSTDYGSSSCLTNVGFDYDFFHDVNMKYDIPVAQVALFTKQSSLTMKVSSSGKRSRSSKSSRLIELNNERIQSAGRRGTKKFIDPNKVFIGNLPYDATERNVASVFADHWAISVENIFNRIESIKIIRDWKTGQSKGYGFIQFFEPMVATSAMKTFNEGKGVRIGGRIVRLDQGKRKGVDDDERQKKREKNLIMEVLNEEERVIHSALETIDAIVIQIKEKQSFEMSEDEMITFMEKGGLRGVMPLTDETAGFLAMEGLYEDEQDDYFSEFYRKNGYKDEDYEDIDDDTDAADDDFAYDGVFEEIYNPREYEAISADEEEERKSMNREQRRAADKKRKKRKLPFKGFGTIS